MSSRPDSGASPTVPPDVPGDTPFVEYNDATAQRLATLIGMSQDLQFTAELLERLAGLMAAGGGDPMSSKSLWVSALAHYARAFEAGARAGVRAGDVFQGLDGDPIGAHRDTLRLGEQTRLPDANPLDRVRVGVVLEGGDGARAVSGTGVIYTARGITTPEAVRQFTALTAAARSAVAKIGLQVQEELLQRARSEPLEELYARSRRVGADGALLP